MDCSMPGYSVLHNLLELAQTHVHWVSDAIQQSHPLLPPSTFAFNLSQHQSLPVNQVFTSGDQSIGASVSATVLPMNIQGWFPLVLIGLISLLSKGLSRVFFTTIQKHQFFGTQPSLWSSSHYIYILYIYIIYIFQYIMDWTQFRNPGSCNRKDQPWSRSLSIKNLRPTNQHSTRTDHQGRFFSFLCG